MPGHDRKAQERCRLGSCRSPRPVPIRKVRVGTAWFPRRKRGIFLRSSRKTRGCAESYFPYVAQANPPSDDEIPKKTRFRTGTSLGEESEMCIDFLCGAVCDSPVVHSISPEPPMPFREVGGHRGCRPNDLISDRFQRGRNPNDETDGDSRCFESLGVGDQRVSEGRVGHGVLRFVHAPPTAGGDDRCQGSRSDRPEAGRVLDHGRPTSYPHTSNERNGEHHARVTHGPVAAPDAVPATDAIAGADPGAVAVAAAEPDADAGFCHPRPSGAG